MFITFYHATLPLITLILKYRAYLLDRCQLLALFSKVKLMYTLLVLVN